MALLLLVFIGFVLGIVISNIPDRSQVKKVVMIVAPLLVGIAALLSSIRVVPAGYAGIVDFFGSVSPAPLKSGIHLVNPLARVFPISVRTIEDKEVMSVPSKEGLNIQLDLSVLYRLDPDKAVDVYRTIGPRFRDVILIPQFRAAARGVTVGYESKALYTSEREMLSQAIFDSLKGMVGERGLVIERVLLRGITLPATVSTAIEQKLKAEQEAERMKFVLLKETQEAQRKRVEAEGIRDAQSIIDQSLTEQYLQYLWINTLNDNPNVIYVATEANMPMFRAINPDEQNRMKKPLLEKAQ